MTQDYSTYFGAFQSHNTVKRFVSPPSPELLQNLPGPPPGTPGNDICRRWQQVQETEIKTHPIQTPGYREPGTVRQSPDVFSDHFAGMHAAVKLEQRLIEWAGLEHVAVPRKAAPDIGPFDLRIQVMYGLNPVFSGVQGKDLCLNALAFLAAICGVGESRCRPSAPGSSVPSEPDSDAPKRFTMNSSGCSACSSSFTL